MERSLQGLPPISKSNGPHFAICLFRDTQRDVSTLPAQRNLGQGKAITSGAWTHVLLGDAAHVSDVGDLPVVVDHGNSDRVLADLGGYIPLHLEAQVLQNQVTCKITGRKTVCSV